MEIMESKILSKLDFVKENIAKLVKDKEVVALISGGKDSATALAIATDANLKITKILHFHHSWSWKVCEEEVRKISRRFNLDVEYIDITNDLLAPFPKGIIGMKGVPCKICKKIMGTSIKVLNTRKRRILHNRVKGSRTRWN
jgi:tRNA(Ile)-lysidine synthase TilS/MesJ